MSQQLAQDIRNFAFRNNYPISRAIRILGLSNSIMHYWTSEKVVARPETERRVRRLMSYADQTSKPEDSLIPSLGAVSFCGIACFLLGYLVAVTF